MPVRAFKPSLAPHCVAGHKTASESRDSVFWDTKGRGRGHVFSGGLSQASVSKRGFCISASALRCSSSTARETGSIS